MSKPKHRTFKWFTQGHPADTQKRQMQPWAPDVQPLCSVASPLGNYSSQCGSVWPERQNHRSMPKNLPPLPFFTKGFIAKTSNIYWALDMCQLYYPQASGWLFAQFPESMSSFAKWPTIHQQICSLSCLPGIAAGVLTTFSIVPGVVWPESAAHFPQCLLIPRTHTLKESSSELLGSQAATSLSGCQGNEWRVCSGGPARWGHWLSLGVRQAGVTLEHPTTRVKHSHPLGLQGKSPYPGPIILPLRRLLISTAHFKTSCFPVASASPPTGCEHPAQGPGHVGGNAVPATVLPGPPPTAT